MYKQYDKKMFFSLISSCIFFEVYFAIKETFNRAQTTYAHQNDDGPMVVTCRISGGDLLLSTLNVGGDCVQVIGPKWSFLAKFISSPSDSVAPGSMRDRRGGIENMDIVIE